MIRRALKGLICACFIFPVCICIAVCRCTVRSRLTLTLAIALIAVLSLFGCAVIPAALERDANQCRNDAWTVADMLKCHELYPAYTTSPSDWASQPVGTLERIIQHKGHAHD